MAQVYINAANEQQAFSALLYDTEECEDTITPRSRQRKPTILAISDLLA